MDFLIIICCLVCRGGAYVAGGACALKIIGLRVRPYCCTILRHTQMLYYVLLRKGWGSLNGGTLCFKVNACGMLQLSVLNKLTSKRGKFLVIYNQYQFCILTILVILLRIVGELGVP